MTVSLSPDLTQLKCWPLRGFAPGMYACTCSTCKRGFLGDKRAGECLECAIKTVKETVSKYDQDLRGMSEELRNAAADAENPIERIAAAAVYHGGTISLPPPARHGHILHTMDTIMGIDVTKVPPQNQGFLTSTGRFVNRVEAKLIAYKAKQIIKNSAGPHCPDLYSEDVW